MLDEGTTVAAAARDLGVTESSLRNWVEQARADRTKGRTGLITAEREELARLRKEVCDLCLERDLQKKSRASSPKASDSLRGDRDREGPGPRAAALSAVRRLAERILRVPGPTGVEAGAGRPTPQGFAACLVHRRPRLLREPARPRRFHRVG